MRERKWKDERRTRVSEDMGSWVMAMDGHEDGG